MSTRDELAAALCSIGHTATTIPPPCPLHRQQIGVVLANLAERGMVIPGPDGEPLDVRPALADYWKYTRALGPVSNAENRAWLIEKRHITGPLADACLAAAEVEG